MRFSFLGKLSATLALLASFAAQAQGYPDKPVRLIVPFPAGTGTDLTARIISQQLQVALGQSFIVDNKPGAGGSIGAMEVVRAAPDGYTLLFASNSAAASNVALLKNMPYDPVKDLAPIAGISDSMLVLMVRADHPAHNLEELMAYVKQRPGKVSAGYGSASAQASLAVLTKLGKVDVLPVPYKGIPQAVNDVMGGIIDFTFVDMGNALAQAKGGKMRALGVTSAKRSSLMPDWPALAEKMPGFDITAWLAVLGPAGLHRDVVDRLNRTLQQILQRPEVREKLAITGTQPMPKAPDQLQSFIRAEVVKWVQLAKDANLEPQ
ncbi:Bug family tripartite tricarboxylate transporter substrate binding protein [Polaromonas sp.]|uniref:Bug family tripartite tricarboxylate transporter substrate binding protein n=1 Tax=Polaromonas sp. TaxID=1869339 RepID=UPI003BAB5BDC